MAASDLLRQGRPLVDICYRCAEVEAFVDQAPDVAALFTREELRELVVQTGGWVMCVGFYPPRSRGDWHLLLSQDGDDAVLGAYRNDGEGWVVLAEGDPAGTVGLFRVLAGGGRCVVGHRHGESEGLDACLVCGAGLELEDGVT